MKRTKKQLVIINVKLVLKVHFKRLLLKNQWLLWVSFCFIDSFIYLISIHHFEFQNLKWSILFISSSSSFISILKDFWNFYTSSLGNNAINNHHHSNLSITLLWFLIILITTWHNHHYHYWIDENFIVYTWHL